MTQLDKMVCNSLKIKGTVLFFYSLLFSPIASPDSFIKKSAPFCSNILMLSLPSSYIPIPVDTLPDTLNRPPEAQQIQAIVVRDFDHSKSLLQRDGPTSHIPESMAQRFPDRSLSYRLNTRAGIQMEERAPASYRLSIRGSSLRSPFGVRNVKVYWNDIPFTRANGVTPLQMLDPTLIGRADVLKGPMGSRFGASNGGVVFFHLPENKSSQISLGTTQGSYGLQRYQMSYKDTFAGGQVTLLHARQQWDGYREHSAMNRENTLARIQLQPSKKLDIDVSILHSQLFYQLPGGLTREQMKQNPRAARIGAAAQNSSIDRSSLYAMTHLKYKASRAWQSVASVYLRTHEFDHPFILDYKQETGYGMGGRWGFKGQIDMKGQKLEWNLGLEAQFELTQASNFENVGGIRDSLRFLDQLQVNTGFVYQELRWQAGSQWEITLGASQNFTAFNIDRTLSTGALAAASGESAYPIYVLPRLALLYFPHRQVTLFANWGRGASVPSLAEVRTNEGSINRSLRPEVGQNHEIGGRYSSNRLDLQASVYYFQLSETITNYTNADGVVLFRNAGATDQWGAELEGKWQLLPWTNSLFKDVHIQQAWTIQSFRFDNYTRAGQDLSGFSLPGVAPLSVFTQLFAECPSGFYASLSHKWTDRLPLNDANTEFQDSNHFMTARVGYEFVLFPGLCMNLFGGVDNMLNSQLSFGNDVNAFGQRFFQPAPGRNYYGGLKLNYDL